MSSSQLPHDWETQRLKVTDSTLDDVPELQQIYDACPSIWGWTDGETRDEAPGQMRSALTEGVLPPNGREEYFRLQSIRLRDTGRLIGFLAVYHGFPGADTLWVNVLAFHPHFQGKAYGKELMQRLGDTVKGLVPYTRMRTCVNLKNWPSLRLCVGQGFDKIVHISGDKVHSAEGNLYIILEKALEESTKQRLQRGQAKPDR
jgi:L-amino acid N-acyltransferase YncA